MIPQRTYLVFLHRWEGIHVHPVTLASYHKAGPCANGSLQGKKAPTQNEIWKLTIVSNMSRLEDSGIVQESSTLSTKQTNPHTDAFTSRETHAGLVFLSPSLISQAAILDIQLTMSTAPVIQHGPLHEFLNNHISSSSLVIRMVKQRKKASSGNRNKV